MNDSNAKRLFVIVIFSLLLAAPASETIAGKERSACRRVSLAESPGLVTAAAWRRGGDELVVVDRLAGKLLRFDAEGHAIGEVFRPGAGGSAIDQPFHVQSVGDALVVQDGLYRLVWLDDSLSVTRSADTGGAVALLDHVVVGDSTYAYGTAAAAANGAPWGFFELSGELGLRRVVQPIGREALAMFSLSRPVVARVGQAAYALDYGAPPTLRRLTEPAASLEAFPEGFERLPSFPGEGGPEAIEVWSGVVERSRVPAQLHGFGRHLYLLTRYPSPGSGTVWELHRIDPARDAIEASFRLPTSSPDLEIVAGEPDWAIFEKGRIRIGGRQEVLGVLLLSASSLDGSEPSPWSDENPPDCR